MILLALARASLHDFAIVGGGVVLVLALITLVRMAMEWVRQRRTRNWPVADGTITEVRYEEDAGFKGDSGMAYWRMHVTYTYTATSQQTGRYHFNLETRRAADAALKSLPGQTVRIHYNPVKESESLVYIQDRIDA